MSYRNKTYVAFASEDIHCYRLMEAWRDNKKIDFVWDVANDHPEKLYQGKAAARLEMDRLLKRTEKLTQQKKDLEGQLAAVLAELETIRKRMDELSK